MSVWRNVERRALPESIDPYQISARPFYNNYSGEIVTELTAFAHSAVMGAVTLLADSIATMPLELTRERAGRIEKMPTPSVLLRPNQHQTMFEFVHQLMLTLALHGNAYIYAPHSAGELPSEMVNIHPSKIKKMTIADDGSYRYTIGKEELTSDDIRCIHWLILPGQAKGISPLEALRNTIGMGIAMDRFLAQFYGEGATPSSVLETEQTITQEQAQILRETWEDSHVRKRRPAVLTGGLKWRSVTTSAADMQMLEHREAIVRDISRAYRIPLHLINGTGGDSQTYQNVESSGINFVRYSLLPFMRRIEDAISVILPVTQAVRFNADEFQRADLITRVRAQQVQIMSGTLTPNEARAQENREPYTGGDQFVMALAGAPIAGVEGGTQPSLGTDSEPPK
ncbi:COG4695 Phage-related protein [uncultured Caudovirales phage]|uniref:COG4695 Phage-related protein n=1 Tax=uncultured Caudovirales phage TaxID=2100421 RepID=A0A6J5S713_9CAUD|nr:COG4695 Phage-related protein [uncultured Caudovirales phage]CAB5229775.1 COG4695 Phage-related protein [uncultured Caudovirales phage]